MFTNLITFFHKIPGVSRNSRSSEYHTSSFQTIFHLVEESFNFIHKIGVFLSAISKAELLSDIGESGCVVIPSNTS